MKKFGIENSQLLDDREKRVIHRKLSKKHYDEIITLSTSNNAVRLLDEGAVVDASGSILFYIMKGTLEKFFNGKNEHLLNIENDYTGTINLGHMDFSTFPVGLIGYWDKSDLNLVDIGDERKALDVVVHLDDKHPLVVALRNAPYDVGLSAEFFYHLNDEKTRELAIEMIDEIFIKDFAVVGECGNVNSSGVSLSEGNTMTKEIKNLTLDGQLDDEIVEEVEDKESETEKSVKEQSVEEAVEEINEDKIENEIVEDEVVEEIEDEEAGEVVGEEVEDEEDSLDEDVDGIIEENKQLKAEIESLKGQITTLKEKNKRVSNKLKAEYKQKDEFKEKFGELSVNLDYANEEEIKEKVATNKRYASGDGIGVL